MALLSNYLLKNCRIISSSFSSSSIPLSTKFNRFCFTVNKKIKTEHLLTKCEDGLYKITLNRPLKKNALTRDMYLAFTESIHEANKMDDVSVILFTGTGDYFCSGNDFNNTFEFLSSGTVPVQLETFLGDIKNFYTSIIENKKLIVVALNGPAIGISVAFLGLFDLVFAAKSTTLHMPFVKLGIMPESCSTYTFPRIMGHSKAFELLSAQKKIDSQTAYNWNLVSRIFDDADFDSKVYKDCKDLASSPSFSLLNGRNMIHDVQKEKLLNILDIEMKEIRKNFTNPKALDLLMSSFLKK